MDFHSAPIAALRHSGSGASQELEGVRSSANYNLTTAVRQDQGENPYKRRQYVTLCAIGRALAGRVLPYHEPGSALPVEPPNHMSTN